MRTCSWSWLLTEICHAYAEALCLVGMNISEAGSTPYPVKFTKENAALSVCLEYQERLLPLRCNLALPATRYAMMQAPGL